MKKLYLIFLFLPLIQLNLYAIDSVEVLSGFLHAEIKYNEDYNAIPLFIALNFKNKSLGKIGEINFVIEPFLNTVLSPDTNIEAGSNFLIKYKYPFKYLQLYIKSGLGALFMTQHTKEQSTQYNFLPQAGAGIQFFIKRNLALNTEYRYRHLSNGSLKYPNKGIDAELLLTGVTYFF